MKALEHNEGYEKWSLNRQRFEVEIELLCLNSEYLSREAIANYLKIYQRLASEYEEASVLKESVEHQPSSVYYEFSLFCDKKDFFKIIENIRLLGGIVDLVHYKEGEYSLDNAQEVLG